MEKKIKRSTIKRISLMPSSQNVIKFIFYIIDRNPYIAP